MLRLLAPNKFVRDWGQQHYEGRIGELCGRLSNGSVSRISFEIGGIERSPDSVKARVSVGGRAPSGADLRRAEGNLNPEFTFDTFVEGKSNQLARAASIQIGQNPGIAYNPLFIYGGVGLGKTHLMHAVGNTILDSNPQARVIYLHSERFVAEMIRSLQHNKIDDFKKTYRSLNALLIDDVQFFAGKDRSQEEFFHTFNALFESRQQIVLSSDRFPKEVAGLEERLKSRFGWGLTVAIDPPDMETSVAILHSKASQLGVALPDDVAFFVGRRIRSNVREARGGPATPGRELPVHRKANLHGIRQGGPEGHAGRSGQTGEHREHPEDRRRVLQPACGGSVVGEAQSIGGQASPACDGLGKGAARRRVCPRSVRPSAGGTTPRFFTRHARSRNWWKATRVSKRTTRTC